MTNQEKKAVFIAIGIMIVILLVVLGVKLFGKLTREENNNLNTIIGNKKMKKRILQNYQMELLLIIVND